MDSITNTTLEHHLNRHVNHTSKHHKSHSLHQNIHHHHGTTLSSTSIVIIILSSISIVVVLAIFLIIAMFRRLKATKDRNCCRDISSVNTSNRFIGHTSISINSSPDVKGGCLYGNNLPRKPPSKYKGVQVFTYKELEVATGRFSQANVIGNGGYGVVYRGILNDGTVAAIKMLHREGKQGERAFRVEASGFI
ncbi:hypothetical protein Tsubulata_044491 [Turnera subulata]|uniref:Protein kinase domain-containing protein n=1 Tax=Turnera subulata TaxID=218843 RepID=A0A9Q0J5Y0_9ROSI|nr:hypothetical protein Tsubulata_044491 [Turnera subulata]